MLTMQLLLLLVSVVHYVAVRVAMGNLISGSLELLWALAWHGAALVPMIKFGEDQLLLPWAACTASTSELIGEDSHVIISLDASQ